MDKFRQMLEDHIEEEFRGSPPSHQKLIANCIMKFFGEPKKLYTTAKVIEQGEKSYWGDIKGFNDNYQGYLFCIEPINKEEFKISHHCFKCKNEVTHNTGRIVEITEGIAYLFCSSHCMDQEVKR